jgi:hypothetical protein
LTGTWNINGSSLSFAQKQCTGIVSILKLPSLFSHVYMVCGHTVTIIGGRTELETSTGEVNLEATEIKIEDSDNLARKESGN